MGKTALFLEGGGMRNVFTAGVLDAFLARQITFDDVYAISGSAYVALSYVSSQPERTKRIFNQYMRDPRYSGYRHFFTKGEFFNRDFIYGTIPNELEPLDYEAIRRSPMTLYSLVTNCQTGEVEYLALPDDQTGIRRVQEATMSLPIMSKPVHYNGKVYMDGGIAKPLLSSELLDMGYDSVLYVMTQKLGYQKTLEKSLLFIKMMYRKYPMIAEHMSVRHTVYNAALAEINAYENGQNTQVIRPVEPFDVKRVDYDMEKVQFAYDQGYEMGMAYQPFTS